MITAVVIDDEKHSRKALKALIEQLQSEVNIVGEAGNVARGIEVINQSQPDLLFLDVRLQNGTGFDILRSIGKKVPYVIFTTAYSEYAIRAIRYSALDYLLKPIEPTELKDAIVSALSRLNENKSKQLDLLEENLSNKDSGSKKIMLSSATGFHIVRLTDIIYCQGVRNYTSLFIKESAPIIISKSLIEFEKMFDPAQFSRIHKSYIINLGELVQYKGGKNGVAILKDGSSIPVSRDRKSDFVNQLRVNLNA